MWHFFLWWCLVLLFSSRSSRSTVLWLVLHSLRHWTKIVNALAMFLWAILHRYMTIRCFTIWLCLFSNIFTRQHTYSCDVSSSFHLQQVKWCGGERLPLKVKVPWSNCVRGHRFKDNLLWNYLLINCRLGSMYLDMMQPCACESLRMLAYFFKTISQGW